ncbi:MAG: hypothetical protein WAV20_09320 [Blastocatellia bacterium]
MSSMTKPSEEGKIWEWRAFGRVNEELAARVRVYPIRNGISLLRGEDIYMVSPNSDQNVKLRLYASGWLLKLKLLFETKTGPIELYNESAEFTYRFPVALERLKDAAGLLAVSLPESAASTGSFGEQDFVNALAESLPPVVETRVSKKRSQYEFENGWLELAEVNFATVQVQSISIHSADIDVVREMVDRLQPGFELEPMNYIEACRRWG